MDLTEARALVSSSYWGKVRDAFLATGTFEVYPKDDPRRFAYLDESVRREEFEQAAEIRDKIAAIEDELKSAELIPDESAPETPKKTRARGRRKSS